MSVQITKEMFDEYVKANKKADMNPANPFDSRARFMTSLNRREWDIIAREYNKLAKEWSKDD